MGALLDMLKGSKPKSAKSGPAVTAAKDGAERADDGEGMPLSSDVGDSDPSLDDESEDGAAFDSFADHAGIPPEKRGAARAALKQYVKACMRDDSDGDSNDHDDY